MQTETEAEFSQQQSHPKNNPPEHPHIQIDTKIIQAKQELLTKFYQLDNDTARLQLIKTWPNKSVQISITNLDNISKTNNAWYFGDSCNQMFHGYGMLIYQKNIGNSSTGGRFYQGQFQNNCKHGYGFEYINGDVYIGKFVNNKPEDVNGIFMWANGDLYMGSFINGMKHGKGRWESGNDYYEGTWKLNRPEGAGKIQTSASQYEGDVKNGYKHGRGMQIFTNGDRYEGLYANGKPEGDGLYSWKNGAVYRGQFKNGIRYGYGHWQFGMQSYEGDYINDKRNGEGVYKWGGTSYYKGQFLDDLRHGFGQMHWNQNSYYRGEWREGMQWGQGQVWQDGNLITKGLFQDGKFVRQPNKLQKSKATQSNKSQPQSNSLRYSQKPTPQAKHKQPPLDNKFTFRKSQQKSSTRYPAIQRKQRLFSHSKNHNLSQIDQFPKVQKQKKYIASTSFSNHTKNSGQSSITNQSFDNNRKLFRVDDQQQPVHQFAKRHQHNYQQLQSAKFVQSKQKKSHMHSKRTLYQKKKMNILSKTADKGTAAADISGNELGPINWKNFKHLKNNTTDFGQKVSEF